MTEQPDDEELHQPRRRLPGGVLVALAGVAVVGVVLVAVNGDERSVPPPRPSSTLSSTTTPPPPSPGFEEVVVGPPVPLVRAVTAAYPRAELVEAGVTVPVRPNPDRSYQFVLGARRITVVVGAADARPEVERADRRDVLVVAKRSGYRVAVTVRAFRGMLRATELGTVRRLVRDTRLLAAP